MFASLPVSSAETTFNSYSDMKLKTQHKGLLNIAHTAMEVTNTIIS